MRQIRHYTELTSSQIPGEGMGAFGIDCLMHYSGLFHKNWTSTGALTKNTGNMKTEHWNLLEKTELSGKSMDEECPYFLPYMGRKRREVSPDVKPASSSPRPKQERRDKSGVSNNYRHLYLNTRSIQRV